MVFVTAGMGGGTGPGAAPVIARAVRELGVLTVGVVTKPFHFEGDKRMKVAERGIEELQNFVDTLIVIPNQNLCRVANERTTFAQAFAMADDVLHSGVRGVTDLIVMPGLINRDFADIKTVMSEMGKAMMGTGEMSGEGRALKAAEAAISNPLLDDVSMKGARAVLVNVTGGPDLMLFEVDEAVNRVRAEVDPDANILFGSALSEDMEGRVRVSVVATGIDAESCIRGDNVQKFPVRRKAAELEVPVAAVSPVARGQAALQNAVHQQVGNLAQEFVARVDMPLPEEVRAVSMQAMPQRDEPLTLGGIEAPYLQEHLSRAKALREFAPQPIPPAKEKRQFFGIFGGRRRAEPPPVVVLPPALAQGLPPQVAPAATPSEPAASARDAEGRPQQQAPADDLFADVAENDRFEIPAFLRRQAKLGS